MFRLFALAVCVCLMSSASPTRAAPQLDDYGKDWATRLVSLSPSGQRFAYVGQEGGKQSLIVDSTDGTPAFALDVGAANVTGLEWAGDDHLLIYVRNLAQLPPGFSRPTAWLTAALVFNFKSKQILKVFDHNSEVADFVEGSFGTRLINGHWYGFFGGFNESRTTPAYGAANKRDLYRVDLDTGDAKRVSQGSDQGGDWLVGPSGDVLARYQYLYDTGYWKVLAGSSGDRVLASGRSKLGAGGELALGRTPDEFVFARPADADETWQWQSLSLSDGRPTDIVDSENMTGVASDRTTGLWIGNIKTEDQQIMELFSPENQRQVQLIRNAFPRSRPVIQNWNNNFTIFIVFTSGSDDSGTYYIVDLNKKTAEPIGYSYPTIEPHDVGPIKMIDYKASDGLALHAVLSLPPDRDAKSLPLVVLPHGGMGVRDYPDFDPLVQAFASRGYAVLQPNSRGSSGYGTDLLNAGYGQLAGKIQSDISDGVAELAAEGVVNSERVCIVGLGWGGYAALAGVTIQHDIYRCAVSINGVSDIAAAIFESEVSTESQNPLTRRLRTISGAKSMFNNDVNASSPARLADRAGAPILLICNKDDVGFAVIQSDKMASALRRAGKSVEQKAIPGAGDETAQEASRIALLVAAVAFVTKYNPPDPEPGRAPK
jgi:dipeptidyl aminopeptidase/acylaminoacyl peptidase